MKFCDCSNINNSRHHHHRYNNNGNNDNRVYVKICLRYNNNNCHFECYFYREHIVIS